MDVINIAAWITAAGVIIGAISILYKKVKKFDSRNGKIDRLDDENGLIIRSMFAVCDGLKQLKCNGEVTKTHKELQEYLIKSRGGTTNE
jgi:hypothetical protein